MGCGEEAMLSQRREPPEPWSTSPGRKQNRATRSEPGWHGGRCRLAPAASRGSVGTGAAAGRGDAMAEVVPCGFCCVRRARCKAQRLARSAQLAPWRGCADCKASQGGLPPSAPLPSPPPPPRRETGSLAARAKQGTSFTQSLGASSSEHSSPTAPSSPDSPTSSPAQRGCLTSRARQSSVPSRGLARSKAKRSRAAARLQQTTALCFCRAALFTCEQHGRIPLGVSRLCREDIKHPLLSLKGQHRNRCVTAHKTFACSSSNAPRAAHVRRFGTQGFTPA